MAIRVGVLTVSDRSSRGERDDLSGPALIAAVREHLVVDEVIAGIVPDEMNLISEQLVEWIDEQRIDLVLTTGGTGFAPRDITPEATQQVIDRPAPGLAEAMRAASLRITPHAMLSRAMAGIRDRALIVNLPGSPKAAVENFLVVAPVLPHAIELLQESSEAENHHHHTSMQ